VSFPPYFIFPRADRKTRHHEKPAVLQPGVGETRPYVTRPLRHTMNLPFCYLFDFKGEKRKDTLCVSAQPISYPRWRAAGEKRTDSAATKKTAIWIAYDSRIAAGGGALARFVSGFCLRGFFAAAGRSVFARRPSVSRVLRSHPQTDATRLRAHGRHSVSAGAQSLLPIDAPPRRPILNPKPPDKTCIQV